MFSCSFLLTAAYHLIIGAYYLQSDILKELETSSRLFILQVHRTPDCRRKNRDSVTFHRSDSTQCKCFKITNQSLERVWFSKGSFLAFILNYFIISSIYPVFIFYIYFLNLELDNLNKNTKDNTVLHWLELLKTLKQQD